MSQKLPKRLRKEPLLEAVFEYRFQTQIQLANVLPGVLYSKLTGDKSLERLPQFDLPEKMRASDQALQYLPLIKIKWQSFNVLISDKSVAVACQLPYPGWSNFKKTILEILSILHESNFVISSERYSLKYIDLVEKSLVQDQSDVVNISVNLGGQEVKNQPLQVRVEQREPDGVINLIQLVSDAYVNQGGGVIKQGFVIDIDTIKQDHSLISSEYGISHAESYLDAIHLVGKRAFFKCLTEQTLKALEPEYDE